MKHTCVFLLFSVLVLALVCGQSYASFPYQTNRLVRTVDGVASPEYEDALWTFSAFDSQRCVFDFGGVTFSNAAFRMLNPKNRNVVLDLSSTNGVAVTFTNLVEVVNEVFTQVYSAIIYTSHYQAIYIYTNRYDVFADYYSNPISIFTTFSTNIVGGTNNPTIQISQLSQVLTGTAPTTAISAYGTRTNYFNQQLLLGPGYTSRVNSMRVWITNLVQITQYGSNLVRNGDFSSSWTNWTTNTHTYVSNGIALFGTANPSTGTLAQVLSGVAVGPTYEVSFNVWNIDSSRTGKVIFSGHTNAIAADGAYKYNAVASNTAGLLTFTFINTSAVSLVVGLDDVAVKPYIAAATNTSIGTNFVFVTSTSIVETVFQATTHTNSRYSYASNDYQRVSVSIDRTNIPPNGQYQAEVLAYSSTQTGIPARTMAKLSIDVIHSVYGSTNYSSWANPAAGTVIGPPVHTLSAESGWPFATKNGDLTQFTAITAPTSYVFTSTGTNLPGQWQPAGISTAFVEKAGDTMTGVLSNSADIIAANYSHSMPLMTNVFDVALGTRANANKSGTAIGTEAIGSNYGVAVASYANGSDEGSALGFHANGSREGSALGSYANGSDEGSALGYYANGSYSGTVVGSYAIAQSAGVGVGYSANGQTNGTAVGYAATAYNSGVAVGFGAAGSQANVAIGYLANAEGGANRTAIGPFVTNSIDNSAALRGTLYLDGATGILYRSTFGTGAWSPFVSGVAGDTAVLTVNVQNAASTYDADTKTLGLNTNDAGAGAVSAAELQAVGVQVTNTMNDFNWSSNTFRTGYNWAIIASNNAAAAIAANAAETNARIGADTELSNAVAARLPLAGGVMTGPVTGTTYSITSLNFTNQVTMAYGKLGGTNGVYWTRNGTNYWISFGTTD